MNKANPIIYDEIKDYFKLDEQGNLWKRYGESDSWKPCYQNKPDKLHGYLTVTFKRIQYLQHRIVYCLATKQDVPTYLQVDHKNGLRCDNNVDNLRLVSHRGNSQNAVKHRNGRLVGSSYDKRLKKWQARIVLTNGEKASLGVFESELEASNRYIEALQLTHLSREQIQKHFNVAQFTSKYKGVSWYMALGKWKAQIYTNGKRKHLGYFEDELQAHQAYLNFKEANHG